MYKKFAEYKRKLQKKSFITILTHYSINSLLGLISGCRPTVYISRCYSPIAHAQPKYNTLLSFVACCSSICKPLQLNASSLQLYSAMSCFVISTKRSRHRRLSVVLLYARGFTVFYCIAQCHANSIKEPHTVRQPTLMLLVALPIQGPRRHVYN